MKIITIGREYGAGGRTVGLAVAKSLGIELYDRDIIRKSAAESGLEYEYITEESEIITKADSILRKITPMQYDQKDALFDMQRDIILKFAEAGPCVILGRCADAILSKAGYDTFNVFLYGSEVSRAMHMSKELGIEDPNEIQRRMKKMDSQRNAFYARYAGKNWGDYKNYDMMLDTGVIGFDLCAKLIVDAVKAAE